MNIFYFDHNPTISAKALPDIYVNKIAVEVSQIMSDALYLHQIDFPQQYIGQFICRKLNPNNPLVHWASKNTSNWQWTWNYGKALIDEFHLRYPNSSEHKSLAKIEFVGEYLLKSNTLVLDKLSSAIQAMPDQYKQQDSCKAYQTYFLKDKLPHKKCVWTWPGQKPTWLQ